MYAAFQKQNKIKSKDGKNPVFIHKSDSMFPYVSNKKSRNQLCDCGSNKKYKKCCINNQVE